MTIVSPDSLGLQRLEKCLEAGTPVIVPLPSPLPYVVVGIDAGAVNEAKHRPRSQPVGVGVRSLEALAPAMQLDPDTRELVRWLCFKAGVSVLVPVSGSAPEWLAPATVDGMAFMAAAWLPELDALMQRRSHLYMSSGNLTSGRPAVTAAEAEAAFGKLLVVDGDRLRDPTVVHGSTTMVAVGDQAALSVARAGINNAAFEGNDVAYVEDLLGRWRNDVVDPPRPGC